MPLLWAIGGGQSYQPDCRIDHLMGKLRYILLPTDERRVFESVALICARTLGPALQDECEWWSWFSVQVHCMLIMGDLESRIALSNPLPAPVPFPEEATVC